MRFENGTMRRAVIELVPLVPDVSQMWNLRWRDHSTADLDRQDLDFQKPFCPSWSWVSKVPSLNELMVHIIQNTALVDACVPLWSIPWPRKASHWHGTSNQDDTTKVWTWDCIPRLCETCLLPCQSPSFPQMPYPCSDNSFHPSQPCWLLYWNLQELHHISSSLNRCYPY